MTWVLLSVADFQGLVVLVCVSVVGSTGIQAYPMKIEMVEISNLCQGLIKNTQLLQPWIDIKSPTFRTNPSITWRNPANKQTNKRTQIAHALPKLCFALLTKMINKPHF